MPVVSTTTAQLNAAQTAALREILERIHDRSAVLTLAGLAGTGKTFLLRVLLEQLAAADWRLLLTAPTHQALAVARSGLTPDVECMTIHAALGLTVREREDGTTEITSRARSKVRGYDLVVVDEASMVGADLYQTLMRERECAVLFVGDPGQLPPIGERESPAFVEVAHRVTLTEIVRQAQGSTLIQIAHAIRSEAENGRRVSLEVIRPFATEQALIDGGNVMRAAELVTDARRHGFDAVAITYTNDDVDRINAAVHRALYPDASQTYCPGERVLFRAPYHEEGRERDEPIVRTNEIGTVLSLSDPYLSLFDTPAMDLTVELEGGRVRSVPVPVNPGAWKRAVKALFTEHAVAKSRAKLETDPHQADRLRELARTASSKAWMLRTRFANAQHAYALTAHRSQGSTYDIVVLHWQGLALMRDAFEHARAVYVAATRPSQYLVIVE